MATGVPRDLHHSDDLHLNRTRGGGQKTIRLPFSGALFGAKGFRAFLIVQTDHAARYEFACQIADNPISDIGVQHEYFCHRRCRLHWLSHLR
jgi:hypothetical protein